MTTDRTRSVRHRAVVAALALAATACSDDAAGPPPGAGPPVPADASVLSINSTRVAKFESTITAMTPDPASSDLFVAERVGKIHRLAGSMEDDYLVYGEPGDVVVDITDSTTTENERGLLGLTTTADDSTLAYVHTALNGSVEVWTLPLEDLDREPTLVLSIPHPFIGHNGGDIITLPNGDLLLSIGDMHVTSVDPPYAQDPNRALGGLVVIPSSLAAFEPTNDDMAARGLRNPWRIHLDEATGELWIADVGESDVEEINRISIDSLSTEDQHNFGWPYLEGSLPFEGTAPEQLALTEPFVELPRDGEGCAVIGGAVYRGTVIPGIVGDYIFGDACSSNIRVLRMNDDRTVATNEVIGTTPEWPVAFATDDADNVYLLGVNGGLYRIDPQGWEVDSNPATTVAPVPTTEPPIPALAPAACGIPGLFTGLESQLGGTPDEIEAQLTASAAELRSRTKNLPPELSSYGLLLEEAISEVTATAAANGFVVTDDMITEIGTSMSDGAGVFRDFPTAIQRIGAADDESCGDGG